MEERIEVEYSPSTVILGASFDTPAENLAFAEAQTFPMRHSYLIDPGDRIHRHYSVTDVASHAADVIADLEAAQTET